MAEVYRKDYRSIFHKGGRPVASKKKGFKKKRSIKAIGLTPNEVSSPKGQSQKLKKLMLDVEDDGGKVLCSYKEPLGGHWVLLTSLPLKQVEPTPYQRKLSLPQMSDDNPSILSLYSCLW